MLASSARLCDSAAASRLERAEVAEETTIADLGRVRVRVGVGVRVRVRVRVGVRVRVREAPGPW